LFFFVVAQFLHRWIHLKKCGFQSGNMKQMVLKSFTEKLFKQFFQKKETHVILGRKNNFIELLFMPDGFFLGTKIHSYSFFIYRIL